MTKTKQQLVKEWMKKHDICGDNPWWNRSVTYYNLSIKNIISIARYLERNSKTQ